MEQTEILDEYLPVRLLDGTRKKIRAAIKNDPERFDTESHFARVAITKLLREVKQ